MEIKTDMEIAERVHRSMIPCDERRGNLDVVCDFTPMIGIGGDYGYVHFQDDTHAIASICDVSGHGIAAALLASRVNSFVLNMAPRAQHPCQIVDALNTFIFQNFRETRLHLTFFCLFLDLESHFLLYSGCGHPPVLFYSKKKDEVVRLESENTIIGIFKDLPSTCSTLRVPFETGDRLVMYTDGITESRNAGGKLLGIDRLESYFKESVSLSTRKCVAFIIREVQRFRNGKPANDDQLLLALSYLDSNEKT